LNQQRNDFFHQIAPYYDTLLHLLTFGGYERFLRKAVTILAPQKGEKILDLCSGTGKVASWISKAVGEEGEVMGMDITQSMINVAKEHYKGLANVIFLKKDVTQPWEVQDHFDGIFTSFSIHELPEKYRAGVLDRSYSALKRHGRMVIADFHPQPSGMAELFTLTFFKLFERRNLSFLSFPQNETLRRAGFRKVKTFPVLGGIFQITFAQR
jgi:demethylmenaquinone methyltransferase/2-methoxy-6-polyprenyl-1,4-benzoquinol methylase